jgi:hypothetical protein
MRMNNTHVSNKWSTEDKNFLASNFDKLSLKEFEKILNRPYKAIESQARRLRLKKKSLRKYNVNLEFFSNENLLSAYWAGFIAADGCLVDANYHHDLAIMLSIVDVDHLQKFVQHCDYSGEIKIRKPHGKAKQDIAHLTISGVKQWFNDLYKLYSITPRKSLTLKPPNIIDINNKLAFIKGVIDGDGSIGIDSSSGQIYIQVVGTEYLLTWIKEIFDTICPSNNRIAKVIKCKNANAFKFKIKGSRALNILDILNKIDTPFLERKWLKSFRTNQ